MRNRRPTQHNPFCRDLRSEVRWRWQGGHGRHMHNIRESGATSISIQHRNRVKNLCTRILPQKCPRKTIGVIRVHLLGSLRRFRLRRACSRKLGRRNVSHGTRTLAHYCIQTSANPSRAQMPHRKAIRGFRGHSPIEVNAVTLPHDTKIGDRLRKIQRRRLRNARNPAAHEGGSTRSQ